MDTETIIIVSVFSGAWLLLFILVAVLLAQMSRLRKQVNEMQATGRIRVQKLRMDNDRNHAFHNPTLSPDEELAKRGYSMYVGDDVENPRGRQQREETNKRGQSIYSDEVEIQTRDRERQTGGQLVDELQREIDYRQQRASTAPPFLLQSIEENKRKSRAYHNPTSHGRQSDTNPNFVY